MVKIDKLRALAASFPETTEEPHFERMAFKVKKKIFATYNHSTKIACIKLSLIDQDVFCTAGKDLIYPAPGTWGKKGWTFIHLKKVRSELFYDAITTAYCEVAPVKLAKLVRSELP
jgi:predicted DNA-binding protein (MmcQ/YjbR family)